MHQTVAPFTLFLLFLMPPAQAQGTVRSEQKISATAGGFGGDLDPADFFGTSACALGDLDGDGVEDVAVGAAFDDDGDAADQGAVWILFLEADGSVKAESKISEASGGFGGALDPVDLFGGSVASLGDLDGDGVADLAVGAAFDDDGGTAQGAVWILFLEADGSVKAERKISETSGGFGGVLDPADSFGTSACSLGDLDGDGTLELAVGANSDDDGGISDRGAVWILSLAADGSVESERKISATSGGFGGTLLPTDQFGTSVAALGDLDGDGVMELAVGTPGDDGAGFEQGAVWILFLDTDGTVKDERKITEGAGGFGGVLDNIDWFGISVAALPDLDSDGTADLAVGARGDDGDQPQQGAVWILFLEPDGTVKAERRIGEGEGGFGGSLDHTDYFGQGLAVLGDIDDDGVCELAVGAHLDDDGGEDQGALWILFLEGAPCFKLDFETEDDLVTPLGNGQKIDTEFGRLVRISGTGANAGPTTFDTTPGGPNDPALNDDMLIGHGNVLLLENDWYSFAQTVPGFFDVVTDDPHGGDMIFDFVSPVSPRSMLLADINPPPNLGASVTLTDGNGRTRVYAVEPGWTGTYGNAGPHRLDLTTLVPQPGNGTPRFATATEMPGFQQDQVTRIVVHMTGYGAIDDLTFCLAQASATTRNGSGRNPTILRSGSRPVPGSTWSTTLDCSGAGSGMAVLELRARAASGTLTPFGEVLVEGALLDRMSRSYSNSPSHFGWQVPFDMSLIGLQVHVQGLCRGQATAGKKTRAARIVLSNALDLVLGF